MSSDLSDLEYSLTIKKANFENRQEAHCSHPCIVAGLVSTSRTEKH